MMQPVQGSYRVELFKFLDFPWPFPWPFWVFHDLRWPVFSKQCQNNLLFKVFSHIMMHRMGASGTKTGFLIHSLLFQLLICLPFYSSQKVYNIAFTSLPWLVSTPISWLSRPGKWNYRIPWLSRFFMTHTNCCAVWNLYHTLSGWTRNSSFSFSKFPCPASLIIIDPMSVELLIRRWSNKELSDWSIRKTSTRIRNLNSVQSLKLRSKSLWQR